jgi:hypothetical protein
MKKQEGVAKINAVKLKAAFVFRTPVCVDGDVKGFVKSVIWTLSDSGRKQCSGLVQPYGFGKQPDVYPSREIKFWGNEPKAKLAEVEPNEHTARISQAFLNVEPVYVNVPNVPPVTGVIKELVYWRDDYSKVHCSAVVYDSACNNRSTIKARIKYVSVIEN